MRDNTRNARKITTAHVKHELSYCWHGCAILQNSGCLSLTHSLRINSKIGDGKFGLKKLETFLYCAVKSIFQNLEPFRHDSWAWQADTQTDSLIAYAALYYVARPITINTAAGEPPTMLIPRLSPGFLTSSTMCGVSHDDAGRLSPDCWGAEVLAFDDGSSSGEIFNGDKGNGLNESSKSWSASECLVIWKLASNRARHYANHRINFTLIRSLLSRHH